MQHGKGKGKSVASTDSGASRESCGCFVRELMFVMLSAAQSFLPSTRGYKNVSISLDRQHVTQLSN
eukprot:scaffold156898_cov21-Tisochrysis_lutea.AAC.2